MATEEILINDEFTRKVFSRHDNNGNYEPIIVESIIKTKDFLSLVNKKCNLETEIIPSNCKYIKTLPNGKKILVMEDEPRMRTVSFDFEADTTLELLKQCGKYDLYQLQNFKNVRPYKLTLSFPYVVYVIVLSKRNEYLGMSVFFRLHSITSLDDYLLEPCLPNISSDYKICLGFDKNKPNSICDATRNILDSFWFNSFNYDYFDHCRNYENTPEVCDFFTWAYNSKVDPLFIFSTEWKNIGYRLNQVIDNYTLDHSNSSVTAIFDMMKNSIGEEITIESYESRNVCESVCIGKNVILSIGDEVQYDDKLYFINSIIIDSFDNKSGIILEDEKENKIELNLLDETIKHRLVKQFDKNNPISIKIGETEIKENDLVCFNETSEIKVVEKIIKSRDNMHHIKIGRNFYLESCFLNENLKKLEGNLKFNDADLIEGFEYFGLNNSETTGTLFGSFKLFYKKYYVDNYGKIVLQFLTDIDDENSKFEIFFEKAKDYKIIEKSKISYQEVFRLNDHIYTNPLDKYKLFIVDDTGIGVINRNGDHIPSIRSSESASYLSYNSEICKNYFNEMCNVNKECITIKSFDNDITYSLNDEVIFIDWNYPDEMFKIRTIVGFGCDDNNLNLYLKDDDNNINTMPIIDFRTGEGCFGNIRKVCREISDIKIGSKVKANVKGIQDFLMKDYYEIKAFVIDEFEPEPLVLFSNYRTQYLSYFIDNFAIIKPTDKKYNKPLSEIDYNIRIQDGDIFNRNGYLDAIIFSSRYRSCRGFYRLTPEDYYSFSSFSFDSYDYSRLFIQHRYGLLYPRYSNSILKELQVKRGRLTIFSKICKAVVNYGIRRME